MAVKKPLIINGGKLEEIKAPDTIDPAVLPATGISRPFVFFAA